MKILKAPLIAAMLGASALGLNVAASSQNQATPSVPIASGPHPAAIETAAPPLDPPLVRSRFQGLRVMPDTGLSAVNL